jgi:ribosomal-protein-serine acetyltransferase
VTPDRFDLGHGAELRRYRLEDAEELFALVDASRGRLGRWLPWVEDAKTVADERAWLEYVLAEGGPAELAYGIWERDRLAGGAGMIVDRLNRSADIGYWLGDGFERRGLVTRATRALADHGFGALGLHRITIHCAPENASSRAVPRRLGFTEEAVLAEAGRIGETYSDLVVYRMLAQDWPPG